MRLLNQIVLLLMASCYVEVIADPYVVLNEEGGLFEASNSASQLVSESKAKVVIIPGSELDPTFTASKYNRYKCSDYTFEFSMVSAKTVIAHIKLIGSVTTGDKPECTVTWDDQKTDIVKVEQVPTIKKHEYSEYKVYQVSFECVDDTRKLNKLTCPEQITTCVKGSEQNLFDEFFKKFSTPMKVFVTEAVDLSSYMELNNETVKGCSDNPDIFWSIIYVNETATEPTSFIQPNASVLRLEPGTLDEGEYIVTLEIRFPKKGPAYWVYDFMILKVLLPELIARITGGDSITASYGDTITVDAKQSRDLATMSSGVNSINLEIKWSIVVFSSSTPPSNIDKYEILFPDESLPTGGTCYKIANGTEYSLKIDTNIFQVNDVCFVMVTMARGKRVSSMIQRITLLEKALPLSIICIYNCNLGRERKFNLDKLELDALLPEPLMKSETASFTWSIHYWYSHTINMITTEYLAQASLTTQTGLSERSIGILKDALSPGTTYKVTVTATLPGYAPTTASVIGTVNHVPYGGSCSLQINGVSTDAGRAAIDWFTLSCNSWKGTDDRRTNGSAADVNALLTYTVIQKTTGALVEEEPMLKTKAQKAHLLLKVGDPNNTYASEIYIRISDMYNNYAEIKETATVTQAFDWFDMTPTSDGADIVRNYIDTYYKNDNDQLRALGKIDLIIPLVSSVCSVIHLIELPIWQPPVPYVLNDGGALLDLDPDGISSTQELDELINDAKNDTIDPATIYIQSVIDSLTLNVKDVIDNFVANKSRQYDKGFISMITNAFNNLSARDNFINITTQELILGLGERIGISALQYIISSADDAEQIETSSGEIYNMSQTIVATVVPADLRQIRTVLNIHDSRLQIGNMIKVTGKNLSLYDAELSQGERAFLYFRMQGDVKYKAKKQKGVAKAASKMALILAKEVQDKLRICATCNNKNSTKTEQLVMKNSVEKIQNETIQFHGSAIFFNASLVALLGNDSLKANTSISAVEFKENVFMYDDDITSSFVTSNVLHIDVKASEVRVSPSYLTIEQTVVEPDAQLTMPFIDPDDASDFSLHKLIYQSSSDYLCLIVKPYDLLKVTKYDIYINFEMAPTILDYHLLVTVDRTTDWKTCISPSDMAQRVGMVYLGIQVLDEVKTIQYYFTVITVGCLTWEEEAKKWHVDKCDLEWLPDADKVICYCRNLTELTFGNSFYAAPNTIDFSSVFLKFSPLSQAAVMGALCCIYVVYVFAIIYVKRLDGLDKLKWGITALRDNGFEDENFYLIKVYTGMRRGAGTKSRIAFNLTGDNGETGSREMFDGVREDFSTGSLLIFLMSVKKHLGNLQHLYIWHDNSGDGDTDSWYLTQVVVQDIDNDVSYTFIAERWLSLDTSLDASLTSKCGEEPLQFESRFFNRIRNQLSESHMWISVAYRPTASPFTRVQRASCVVVYILLTMVANALYFNPEDNYESAPLLKAGPFRFTLKQMYISAVCAAISTPPIMLIVFLFKYTDETFVNVNNRKTRCNPRCGSYDCLCTCRRNKNNDNNSYVDRLNTAIIDENDSGGSCGFRIYQRFLWIAWLLVLAGIVAPSFFIILFSIEWGKQKSEEWLTTILMSIGESIIFVDPIIVVTLTLLLSLIFRQNNEDRKVNLHDLVENYKSRTALQKDNMGYVSAVLRAITEEYKTYASSPRNIVPPAKKEELERVAEKRRHEQQLMTMVRNIILNLLLMFVIYTICYSNRDDRSYRQREEIVNQIVTPWKLPQFQKIKSKGELFDWMNRSVIPSLFPVNDINGSPLHWTIRQFTTGYFNYRLGPPRLRQLRTSNHKTCNIPYIGHVKCYDRYTMLNEDDEQFCIGWTKEPCPETQKIYNYSLPAWKFTHSLDIWGLPLIGDYTIYNGGGYIANFDINRNVSITILNELFRSTWLDRHTRAVMLEFTLYCGVTQLFIYNNFMVEFPETGGAVTTFSIYPLRVNMFESFSSTRLFVTLCEIMFVFYLLILLVKMFVRFYQQGLGYFKQFWQIYEFFIFWIGVSAIAVFFIRLRFTYLTITKYKEDKRQFVNFSHIVFWDQLLATCLGILAFMATTRILQIFGSSKQIDSVIRVFKKCGKDMLWFGCTFLYLLFGFTILGYLLFGSLLPAYRNIYHTLVTLSLAFVGKTNYKEIDQSHPILAKVFFILYVISILMFVLSLYLSILGESIDEVVNETRHSNKTDLVEYVGQRIKQLIWKPSKKKSQKITPQKSKSVGHLPSYLTDDYSLGTQAPPVHHVYKRNRSSRSDIYIAPDTGSPEIKARYLKFRINIMNSEA